MLISFHRRPPVYVYAYRESRWQQLLSDELCPGDVISVAATTDFLVDDEKEGDTKEEATIPCDAVIIRGSCVANEALLTGESVPQVKESIRTLFDDTDDNTCCGSDARTLIDRVVDIGDGAHSNRDWDRHMLFSGTSISQHTETLPEEERLAGKGVNKNSFCVPRAPDKGCQAIVLRTGFGSCQGGLMRTILYSSERVTTSASSYETFAFIGLLVIFALVASGVVLYGGLYDENRNKFKLILHCIMIITSVVPPELPMELSLAVTTSLSALIKSQVYCTEAFRINFAGKVNVLCFDKTGTLTQDKMVLRGIVDPQNLAFDGSVSSTFTSDKTLEISVDDDLEEFQSPVKQLLEPDECADLILTVMASCQALITTKNGSILGDPLEVETFRQSEFCLAATRNPGLVTSAKHDERGLSVNIVKRYPFSSALKRMSVIANVSLSKTRGKHQIVCCKGAPEIIEKFLNHVPANYVATYQLHMALGRRVIALAFKPVGISQDSGVTKSRTSVESDLIFLSFLVFDSSLKSDTKSVMKELRNTEIPTKMITGDSPFTAADIGQKLYITKKDKPYLVLDVKYDDRGPAVVWRRALSATEQLQGKSVEDSSEFYAKPLKIENLSSLKSEYNLIATGGALATLEDQERMSNSTTTDISQEDNVSTTFQALSSHVQIFARTSPQQKEKILWALNKAGFITLMCGDGASWPS